MPTEGDKRADARTLFWRGVIAGVSAVGDDLLAEAVARAPLGRGEPRRRTYRATRGLARRDRRGRVARHRGNNDARTGTLRASARKEMVGATEASGPPPSGGVLTSAQFGGPMTGQRDLQTPASPTATSASSATAPKDGQAVFAEVSFATAYAAAQHQGYAVMHRGGKAYSWRAKRYSTPGTGPHFLSDPLYLKARRYTNLVALAGRARMGPVASGGGPRA